VSHAYPLRLEGNLDRTTSRWLWLFKWLLVVPHIVVLALLGVGLVFAWIGAFFAILFAGRYPRGLFAYNVGVLRWGWRVSFYFSGAFATDRYPPFSLEDTVDYPARLDVAYPEHLNRGLMLVKWLLAVPHLIIVGLLVGGSSGASWQQNQWAFRSSGGLIAILAFVAAVILTFSGNYPRGLFDLLMGLNRWVYRVYAYVMLMTDEYPRFRLDSGVDDPATAPDSPAVPTDRS
jgi:hypothetical protein